MVNPEARELERLLKADARAMQRDESQTFLKLARERAGDIVLFGAGGLGRKILVGLRANEIEPLAFADNSPARQGTTIDGLPVMSPAAAAAEFADTAIFVVTIWGANSPHRFAHSRDQLAALGCSAICFPPLCWMFPESLLPHYLQDLPHKVLEQRDDVRRAYDVWADDASRTEYVDQVRFRMLADFDGLGHPVAHPQYFPDDLYDWRSDEWIVDGGAYDGDSIRKLTELHGQDFGHVLALEPDPVNFARLVETTRGLPPDMASKIDCRQLALGATRGTLHLDARGDASSVTTGAAADGTIAVPAERLDDVLAGAIPTFIKLDIEGAEPDALTGARETITSHAPVIAVCVYHLQDHLWKIPLMLKAWRDDYSFFLRSHNEEGWDLVCYAVPRARLAAGAGGR